MVPLFRRRCDADVMIKKNESERKKEDDLFAFYDPNLCFW
jgi:hypothetical protein